MKLRILCIISLASSMPVWTSGHAAGDSHGLGTQASAQGKRTIAVLGHSDFLPDQTELYKTPLIGLPDVLTDRIIEHLTNSRRFVVVERTALRRVVMEQRFGRRLSESFTDPDFEKSIMDRRSEQDLTEPGPSGGQVVAAFAGYRDKLKDFLALGIAVGADYLLLGRLEKLSKETKEKAVPYSTEGRTFRQNVTDARLHLRVIEVQSGTVAGATSFRTKVKETVFEGKDTETDEFSFYDHLGRLAALKVLDVTFPARIASVQPLVLTRGSVEGVRVGDIYLVEREGKEIKDQTGIVIGRVREAVGRVEVVRSQETLSIVRPVAGTGFAEGDVAFLDVQAAEKVSTRPVEAIPLVRSQATQGGIAPLPRLAIGLIKSKTTAGTAPEKIIDIFTDTLISRLVQTKRFQLADRQEVDQLLDEQMLEALREDRDLASAVGTLKAVDYLVYGNLALFEIDEEALQLPGSSRVLPSEKVGRVEGNMRVVNARTGDILESRKVSVEQDLDPDASGDRIVDILADAYAEQVVVMLMNAIYPIKVAAFGQDGTVYINRGNDGGLSVGEMLNAFRLGPPVIDPDTERRIGFEETPLGQVVLNEVEDATSKGVLVSGQALRSGDLLKRSPENRGKRAVATTAAAPPLRTGPTLPAAVAPQVTTPRQGGKFTLALGTLGVSPDVQTDLVIEDLLDRATNDLVVKLTNTNRFVVMEREQVDQILDEKDFERIVKGGKFRDRLRELEGADYLVLGEIVSFYVATEREFVTLLDEESVRLTGVAEGTLRIVDVHSGSVVAADKVRIRERIKPSEDRTFAMSTLMDHFTSEIVGNIVARLFPIKLLGVNADGTVFINRGADGGIARGMKYDVMRPGPELRDPDTGILFGVSEAKIGEIEIVAVEPSRARARLIAGGDVVPGDILREPIQPVAAKKPGKIEPKW